MKLAMACNLKFLTIMDCILTKVLYALDVNVHNSNNVAFVSSVLFIIGSVYVI
jgi:hypothetical protein